MKVVSQTSSNRRRVCCSAWTWTMNQPRETGCIVWEVMGSGCGTDRHSYLHISVLFDSYHWCLTVFGGDSWLPNNFSLVVCKSYGCPWGKWRVQTTVGVKPPLTPVCGLASGTRAFLHAAVMTRFSSSYNYNRLSLYRAYEPTFHSNRINMLCNYIFIIRTCTLSTSTIAITHINNNLT